MSGFMKMAKLDFVTMKSQFWSYASLLLMIILFWVMGSSITVFVYNSRLVCSAVLIYTFFIAGKE